MGEGNDEKRAGFDYWASHKGQGQYYDTPFNVDGHASGDQGLLRRTWSRTWQRTG